ncbi:sulfatase-like hydrolase/transferase [Luteolibacter sp. LG18]|uniref:sulfatase-like hydrolase/transferase n=1 Tax=Luteolibacter sp. LG18 TaxID=2819286 RepID=UPI0030C69D0F
MLSVRRFLAIANAILLGVAAAADSPNVLVLSTPGSSAPELKPLQEQGTSFAACYASPSPVKTLAAWLTGCHELRAGVVDERGGRNFIRPDVPLVSDAFKAAGYRTGLFGSWGLGDALPFRPEDRGFVDVLVDGGGLPGDHWGNTHDSPWLRTTTGWKHHEGRLETVLSTESVAWIEARKIAKERFFLQVNLPAGCESSATTILAGLDRLGLTKDTIVVGLGLGGKPSANSPEAQSSLVIRWPDHVAAGKTVQTPVAVYDGFPTLAGLCGAPLFRDAKPDGVDLKDALTEPEKPQPERTFYFHPGGWPADQVADRFKSEGFVVRRGKWRLSGLELQDLSQPADKRGNEFEKQADLAMELMTGYGAWWQSVRPTLADRTRIIVGDTRQPVVPLTWGDWWPSRESTKANGPHQIPDHAALKRLLADLADPEKAKLVPATSGVWKIHANQTGHYKLTLWKVPAEADAAERDRLGKLKAGPVHARSGKYEVKSQLLEGATSISLGVDLNEGDSDLEAWFESQAGPDALIGAFFATIERVGERKMPDPDFKARPKEDAK